MVSIGDKAPDFALVDHFGRKVEYANLRGRCQVMLLFYPLDWTPT